MEILRLASLTSLGSLSLRELTAIAPYAREASLPAGRRVLLDGAFAQELVLVVTGRACVRCAGEIVAELGPGDAFGALAPRQTAYSTATVTALSALRLVTFSTRDVRGLRQAAPDALAALLAACAQAPQERADARRPVRTARPPAPVATAAA
jgi:CRP-like cAMP-binding protein